MAIPGYPEQQLVAIGRSVGRIYNRLEAVASHEPPPPYPDGDVQRSPWLNGIIGLLEGVGKVVAAFNPPRNEYAFVHVEVEAKQSDEQDSRNRRCAAGMAAGAAAAGAACIAGSYSREIEAAFENVKQSKKALDDVLHLIFNVHALGIPVVDTVLFLQNVRAMLENEQVLNKNEESKWTAYTVSLICIIGGGVVAVAGAILDSPLALTIGAVVGLVGLIFAAFTCFRHMHDDTCQSLVEARGDRNQAMERIKAALLQEGSFQSFESKWCTALGLPPPFVEPVGPVCRAAEGANIYPSVEKPAAAASPAPSAPPAE